MARRSSGGKTGFRGSQPVMADPLAADAIVAFDFDGTLTTHDSFTTFLKWRAGPVRYDARRFAERHAPILFRPDALATWRRWRAKGAKTIIVTASPDFLVAPFARGLGADTLIASALAFDDSDRATGALLGPNCRGKEKVKRLQDVFGPDVRLAAAYGDTSGDRDMLKIADEKGYRVFRAKPA